jgi:phosphoribosyl 1,2-cyclic phosphodiesterase
MLDHPGLDHLVAAHLSEKNNTVELASEAILTATPGMEARLTVTGQDLVSGWFEL